MLPHRLEGVLVGLQERGRREQLARQCGSDRPLNRLAGVSVIDADLGRADGLVRCAPGA